MAAARERLGHLKFMQLAERRREEEARQEKAAPNAEDSWVLNSNVRPSDSCVVIFEGDPKPSGTSGRMSFRNFNPAFEVQLRSAADGPKSESGPSA